MKRHLNRIALIVVLASGSTATLYGQQPLSPAVERLNEDAGKKLEKNRKDYDEAIKKTVEDTKKQAEKEIKRLAKENKTAEVLEVVKWLEQFEQEVLAGRGPQPINPNGNKPGPRVGRSQPNPAKEGAVQWNKGHWYKVIPEQLTWKQAEKWCADARGHLVIIENKEEQNALVKWLTPQPGQPALPEQFWIGATDEINEGAWLWVDGSAVNFKNWKPREPDNNGNEHYAAFSVNDVGGWSDHGGGAKLPFICEWDQ